MKWNFLARRFAGSVILGLLCFCAEPAGVYAEPIKQSGQHQQVISLDYQRNSAGTGVLEITLSKTDAVIDVRKSGSQLQIDIFDTFIPDDMLYVLDVSEFSTAVTEVETFRHQEGVRLVLTVSQAFDYDYLLAGTQLKVMISEVRQSSSDRMASEASFSGKPISINFQDIPVRHVLQLIADHNDFNLVVADSVAGNVTLRLDGVPWQQVLDIILQAKGLDKRTEGNVIMVAPKAELDASEQQALAAKRKEEELASLRSEVIQVNYANAADLADLLSGQDDGIGMLSERGSVTVDERTNALVIRELADNITIIRDMLALLDIPVKQVQIEARIVTVNEGDLEELGVRWGITKTENEYTVGGSVESNLFEIGNYDGEDGKLPVDDFLNVNLAAVRPGASSIAFQVARLGSDLLLDLELSALQAENKAEIISSPRLLTTNKKVAYIEQGTQLPYLEASSSGAVAVSFKKAVLSLMVTPQITPDNKLVLDLTVTQDRPGKTVKAGKGEAVAIDTQRISTQVLVENGETVVLGGIYQQALTTSVEKVPLLGDLPLLGALFRRSFEGLDKRELLIFVTPRIVLQ